MREGAGVRRSTPCSWLDVQSTEENNMANSKEAIKATIDKARGALDALAQHGVDGSGNLRSGLVDDFASSVNAVTAAHADPAGINAPVEQARTALDGLSRELDAAGGTIDPAHLSPAVQKHLGDLADSAQRVKFAAAGKQIPQYKR
jgi:hypothetical protein